MENQNQGSEKRRSPRVSWHFMVHFKLKDKKDAYWGVSAGKDISEEGCFFLSEAPFKVGEILDVKVQFPGVQEGMHFLGEVKRCEQEENQLDVYGVGMSFIEVDEEKKQTFLETLDFFLKRRKEKWSVEKNVFIRRYF